MMGGYKEDSDLQGLVGKGASTCYNFTHWSYIDTFIYFSHERVSLPPSHWINAAHSNNTVRPSSFYQGQAEERRNGKQERTKRKRDKKIAREYMSNYKRK